jgi:very-short-patch-repair endonuclease
MTRRTEAQTLLGIHLRELLPDERIEEEYRFCEGKRWAFDLCCPKLMLAFECDGGMWTGGHKRGAALEDDYMKQNTAQLLGWTILRFSNEQVDDARAREFVNRLLAYRALDRLKESLK